MKTDRTRKGGSGAFRRWKTGLSVLFPAGRKARRAGLFLAVILLWGCATYQPMPIAMDAVNRKLAAPGIREIRVRAASIRHPILKPIPFDERDGLSPDEAAILAVIANPSLRAERDTRGLAAAQLLQARILPNPQISYSIEAPVGGDPAGKTDAYGLGIDWGITSLVAQSARLDAAGSHAVAVDLGVAWKEWQVAEAAKLYVYRLSIAERRLAVAEKAGNVYERSYKTAKRGVELGVETVACLSAVEAALQKARADILQARAEVNTERLELNRVLGLPGDQAVKIENDIHPILLQTIPSARALSSDIDRRRLDILALRYGYESQEARLRAAIRSQFPKINIGLTRARDTDGLRTAGAGISISIPLFDRNQGRIASERAMRQRLFDEYAARLFGARADIARIVEALRSTARQIEIVEESIRTSRELAARYRRAFDEDRVNILDYDQVLERLYSKECDRLALKRRFADLTVALEIASGRYIFPENAPPAGEKHTQTRKQEAPR